MGVLFYSLVVADIAAVAATMNSLMSLYNPNTNQQSTTIIGIKDNKKKDTRSNN